MTALGPDFPLSRDRQGELKRQNHAEAIRQANEYLVAIEKGVRPKGPKGKTDAAAAFLWDCELDADEFRVVLLSQDRRELAWSEPLVNKCYVAEGAFREALARRGAFYWYAVARKDGRQLQSEAVFIEVR